MKYIIKNKNTGALLKYFRDIEFKHYVFTIKEATHFIKYKQAYTIKRKYKHPENWEIIRVKGEKIYGNN